MSDTTPPLGGLLGDSGAPLALTFRDRSHPISPPTAAVLDRVEKLVALRANEMAEEMARTLPPAAARRHADRLDAKLGAGQHKTGGELWAAEFEADGGARGLQLILFCCLEDARARAADKDALPKAIPFDDIPTVLDESPDAGVVAKLLLPDFFRAAGARRKLPAAEVDRRIRAAVEAA